MNRGRPHARVAPASPTLLGMIAAAEAELTAAYEATEEAYEAGGTLARMRWDARPHPQFAAWGNDWTRTWGPGEHDAAVENRMAAFDAAHDEDRREIEADETEAGERYARALVRLALLGGAS